MEENDDPQADVPSAHNTQEIFQRAQETQADRRFPVNSSGIVAVPRGSKGPRSLYLKRYGDSFGFTLRHFIVYPPEGVTENDGRHAACGALLAPLDTIFVKHVRDRSAAKQAGLQRGDRLVAVNGQPTTDLTYQQVVNLISKSPDYLHLLVVPKEEDVLQRFFPDTAYNPVSNQDNGPVYPEVPLDRATAQQILTQRIAQRAAPQEFRVDAASWRYLNQPYFPEYDYQHHHPGLVRGSRQEYSNRSTDSVLDPRRPQQHQEIYAEIHHPNEVQLRQKSRAQPQVPLYRKMGRRASEGSHLVPPGGGGDYSGATSLTSSDGENYYYHERMRAMQNKPYYLPSSGDGLATMDAGCRLQSSEATRRESTSSISSSIADSSKGSTTTSYDSNSTLTGHEMDEEASRLAAELRVRQSVRQKEEFLRTPVVREFHGKPKRLERPVWPPNGTLGIPYEGDYGGVPDTAAPTAHAYSPRDRRPLGLEGVREAETAPSFAGEGVAVVQSAAADDRRSVINYILAYLFPMMNHYHHAFQNVQKKAKEFETCAEDSPRTDLSRSELARLSTKVLQPNVTERAHEYEAKTNEGARTKPTGATPSLPVTSSNTCSVLKRIQKDSRSLDSSGSNGSVYHDPLSSLSKQQRLSGNVIISSGSKYIHCPPPEGAAKSQDISSNNETTSRPFRARSNSAESWTTANGDKESATPPMVTPPVAPSPHSASPLLVPLPVLQMHFPHHQTVGGATPPPRPHTLDLAEERPQRPARGHFKSHADSQDERNRRPESYLKATKGDQTSFGSDLSDNEDLTPQGMRNRYRKWQPSPFYGDIEQLRKLFEDSSKGGSGSSSSSLDREKFPPPVTSVVQYKKDSKVIREGLVHCKILQIDGKRAADRSWKQVTMVLKGPKLFLYKERHHHQSPLGTSDVSLDQSLSGGVDMRTSVVRVAEDYTKRKNVLRLSSVNPCRSEFLIQTENSEDLADWAKTLQEQVAVSTKAELDPSFSRQQAVPQTHPASTSIQVQGSHLSPQPSAKNGKSTMAGSTRNRSPTGQSPVSKTRKPSAQHDPTVHTSPKSKTWRGRVAKQFKKFNQGGHSPSSPTAPEGSTFGVPIEHCIPSQENCYLPRIVKVCTDIIDEKGLQMKGIYRIPGNCAAITALTEEINRNYEDVPLEDPKWNDIHVVSSLLKSYFRKMPDSLITAASYPQFVKADKIEDPKGRLEELKRLVRALPRHNYYTLKHVVGHLKRVNDNSHVNQMDTKNLSIVFGPTIFLTDNDTMEVMVANMNNHANIVQSLITHVDWFFPEDESESPPQPPLVPLAIPDNYDDFEASNQVLLNNIGKFEVSALNKEQKEKNGALLSSLFTAAQRKVMRKPSRSHNNQEGGGGREEPTTPTSPKTFAHFNMEQISEQPKIDNLPSITAKDMEKKDRSKPPCSKQQGSDKDPWFNYKTDQQEFSRRIENFKQETEAMLQRPRTVPISVDPRTHLSSSANNVSSNQQRLSTLKQQQQLQQHPDFLLTKTHSATNVFTRPASATNRNSMDSMVQYSNSGEATTRYSYSVAKQCGDSSELDGKIMASRYGMRRGSSVENVNTATGDVNANGGGMKKVKYENENDCQRRGSLESLHKLATEDESLLSTMTKLIDQKLKEKSSLGKEEIPFVDESPEKPSLDKETRVRTSDLYKNPSLHKGGQYVKPFKPISKESNKDRSTEKEEDTSAIAPDNERHISLTVKINNSNNKLKRSESLNKPERTIATNNKVKRSESLNKPGGDKLKRSDSLTKSEKTESNINKKRELLGCGRRLKETTKNKRKNGMPDRSIKRRHTVGGTKDPDKVTYIMDNENQSENDPNNVDNNKEKGIRTSSPDLSSTRRGERYLFEINLIGPENMVVALRQHFVGSSRPQSFPESNVFKVPLESHV
ncbi:rho GTPase-activating protein 21 isoform X3 [Anthonomus grandis grandis]|uniref:rho GTPase-activating protein 21 isoform X3 n=1 Tax=Anthonomus grandis grandis TaxID=2921223 RepID=UPI002165DB0B|nr:rho GTPase-activating protein 21 isoform X3 [Anthonomus grandis grandis]